MLAFFRGLRRKNSDTGIAAEAKVSAREAERIADSVAAKRKDLFDDTNFPISGFLRNSPPRTHRRKGNL